MIALSLGLINTVDNPTRQTFVAEMVGTDQLRNAVTLNSVMVNVARAIGPAVAGVLIASVGSGWCFLINAVSFGFVLLSLRAIHVDELALTPRAKRVRGQIREGFRYVGRTPLLRDALIMMALIGCLTYEFQTTLPLMAGNTFHGDARTYGLLTACMGLGAVVGGLVAAGRRGHGPNRLVNTAGVFGVAVLGAALAPSLGIEAVILLLVGACSVTFLSLGNVTLQLGAEPAMRGRVMSLWSVAFLGSTPIGGPLVGLIGGSLGARYALGVGGVAALVAAAYGRATLRRRRRQPPLAAEGNAPEINGVDSVEDIDDVDDIDGSKESVPACRGARVASAAVLLLVRHGRTAAERSEAAARPDGRPARRTGPPPGRGARPRRGAAARQPGGEQPPDPGPADGCRASGRRSPWMSGGQRSTTASTTAPTSRPCPDLWRRWSRDLAFVPDGGESLDALGRRVRQACDELWPEAVDDDIVVVTHVSPIKAAVAWALGVGDETSWRMFVDLASVSLYRGRAVRSVPADLQRDPVPPVKLTFSRRRRPSSGPVTVFAPWPISPRHPAAPAPRHRASPVPTRSPWPVGARARSRPGVSSTLPVYIDRGEGAVLIDVDGNALIDLGSGIAVTSVGHAVPAVVEAVREQVGRFAHTCFMVGPYEGYVAVCEQLNARTPGRARQTVRPLQLRGGGGGERREDRPPRHRPASSRGVRPRLPRPHQPDHGAHGQEHALQGSALDRSPRRSTGSPMSYPFRDPAGFTGRDAAGRAVDLIDKQVGAANVACRAHRAGPGRRRLRGAGAGLPGRAGGVVRGTRRPAGGRRSAVRILPDGRLVRLRTRRCRARPDRHGQGHRRRNAAGGGHGPRRDHEPRPQRRTWRYLRRESRRVRRRPGRHRDHGAGRSGRCRRPHRAP